MHRGLAGHVVVLPTRSLLARDIVMNLGEGVVLPLVIFYAVLVTVGFEYALLSALGWAYLAVVARLVRRQRPPGILLIATLLATVRVGISAASGSPVAFFLQPTATTFLFAVALLATAMLDKPLIQRLADDFCPLPAEVVASPPLRRFFQRLSLLWAFVLLGNAGITLGMLLTMPTTISVPLSAVSSLPLFLLALGASWRFFHSSLRSGGFTLRWGSA